MRFKRQELKELKIFRKNALSLCDKLCFKLFSCAVKNYPCKTNRELRNPKVELYASSVRLPRTKRVGGSLLYIFRGCEISMNIFRETTRAERYIIFRNILHQRGGCKFMAQKTRPHVLLLSIKFSSFFSSS